MIVANVSGPSLPTLFAVSFLCSDSLLSQMRFHCATYIFISVAQMRCFYYAPKFKFPQFVAPVCRVIFLVVVPLYFYRVMINVLFHVCPVICREVSCHLLVLLSSYVFCMLVTFCFFLSGPSDRPVLTSCHAVTICCLNSRAVGSPVISFV